jgi:damage-control phosphatase, subfamily I
MNTETATTKEQKMVDEKCEACFLKTYMRLFQKFNVSEKQQHDFLDFFNQTMLNASELSSPEIQRILSKNFCKIIHVADPFFEEKKSSNCIALELYKTWKPRVIEASSPFDMALRLAIAGNVMDYGASSNFDINKTMENVINAKLAINHSALLRQRILNANKILILGDNAGEIVFDKLFIETIMHSDVTYAVKDGPILNDVTLNDAEQTGMLDVADVISNGFDAPSTVLKCCSKDFMNIYQSADLIISKGQGNFEGLMNENDPRIFFLLMAKCDTIGNLLNVSKGSFVVYNQFFNAN